MVNEGIEPNPITVFVELPRDTLKDNTVIHKVTFISARSTIATKMIGIVGGSRVSSHGRKRVIRLPHMQDILRGAPHPSACNRPCRGAHGWGVNDNMWPKMQSQRRALTTA